MAVFGVCDKHPHRARRFPKSASDTRIGGPGLFLVVFGPAESATSAVNKYHRGSFFSLITETRKRIFMYVVVSAGGMPADGARAAVGTREWSQDAVGAAKQSATKHGGAESERMPQMKRQ